MTTCLYSHNNEIQQTIELLLEQKLSPLPVAPAQDSQRYPAYDKTSRIKTDRQGNPVPAFDGKNPSYLDVKGIPHLIKHQKYHDRLPTPEELKLWFQNPNTGVGALGNHEIRWLDLDRHKFSSQEECDRAFYGLLEKYPDLAQSWIEQTQGGGYRLLIKLRGLSNFTNFCLTPGGPHVGEILGHGKFAVLSPTIGPSGNPYQIIHRDKPVEVESLEAIGIFSTKAKKEKPKPQQEWGIQSVAGSLYLCDLINDGAQEILGGASPTDDRSEALATFIQESYGWENFCTSRGIGYSGSTQELTHQAGEALEIESQRIGRILKTVDANNCHTAAEFRSGNEVSCWKKIYRLDRATYQTLCPKAIQDTIAMEWGETRAAPSTEGNLQPEGTQSYITSNGIPINYRRNGTLIVPKPSKIARELSEKYRSSLAWNATTKTFWQYSTEQEGVWTEVDDRVIQQLIAAEIEATPLADHYGSSYISNIFSLMADKLFAKDWDQQSGLLPMQNGVLEFATMRLLEHSPGYRFTYALPYPYIVGATCEPVQQWILETMQGKADMVQLLRAYLNAVIKSQVDLQVFLECLGPGGTGKSTFTRLAIALVGSQNVFSTELRHLEQNRFEASGIVGKKLVLISDSDRYTGAVTVLKSLTGQDPLRFERKHQQQGSGFIPQAMVIICANEPIQTADYSSGLQRRRVTVPFLNQVPGNQRRDLLSISALGISGEFCNYLPGVLNWVLAMTDQEIRGLLLNPQQTVPSLNEWRIESLLSSNPLAEWLDSRIILKPGHRCPVGTAKKERRSEGESGNYTSWDSFRKSDEWLYASYCQYCAESGNRAIGIKRFSQLLEDLCRHQLGLDVTRGRDRAGSYFIGLSIRGSSDQTTPSPITSAFCHSNPTECDDKNRDCDKNVTARTRSSDKKHSNYNKFKFWESDQEIEDEGDGNPPSTDYENRKNSTKKQKISGLLYLLPFLSLARLTAVTNSGCPVTATVTNSVEIVEVIRGLPGRLNPVSCKLEGQYKVKLSDGTTKVVFESELESHCSEFSQT